MGLFDSGGGSGGGGFFSSAGGGMSGILGGDIIAGAQTNNANSWQADHAMDRSEEMARTQMAFQERMSNTAYQRGTEDMKKAGINPMVAFEKGGASSPGGAMGSSSMATMKNPVEGALSSAYDAVRLKKELAQADSGIALNQAQATNALAQAGSAGSSAKLTDANTTAIKSQLGAIAAKAGVDTLKAGYDQKAVGYDAIMSRANRDAGTAGKVMNLFKPAASGLGPNEMKINSNTGEVLQEGQP